jgi:hypothetical protein
MSQGHCRMHQVVSSMSQAATTGTAGRAGATVIAAGGATKRGTAGGLETGLTTLRRGAYTHLGANGLLTGRSSTTFFPSASSTQARTTRATSTCKTGSKILV